MKEAPKNLIKISAKDLRRRDKGLNGLPDFVKDPANFLSIQKALLDCLATVHSHAEMSDFFKCFPCQLMVRKHKEMMKKFGFTTPGLYISWKKRQEEKREVKLKLENLGVGPKTRIV